MYLFRTSSLQVSGKLVLTDGVIYQAALNVPELLSNELFLISDTTTTLNNENRYMLVTYTDTSKSMVSQIEQFSTLNTLQLLTDWRNRVATVITLLVFGLLAQVIAAYGFTILFMIMLYKRQKLTIFHLMGLSLSMSIGFFYFVCCNSISHLVSYFSIG